MNSKIRILHRERGVFELVIIITLLVAAALAFYPLLHQFTFYYDQARDAYEAYAIWHNHDIKILGPATDIPNVFHGVFWYYLLAMIYGVSQGNPQTTAIIFYILFFLSVIPLVLLVNELFHSKKVTFFATLLYVFSPLFQLSTRWLSNPILGMLVTPWLLLMLWRMLQKATKINTLASGVLFGLLIHSNTGYGLTIFSLPLLWWTFRKRISWHTIIVFSFSLGGTLFPYLLAEMKFHWRGVISAIHFFTQGKHGGSLFPVLQKAVSFDSLFLHSVIYCVPPVVLLVFFLVFLKVNRRLSKDVKDPLLFLSLWLITYAGYIFADTGLSRSLFVYFPYLAVYMILIGWCCVEIGKRFKWFYIIPFIFVFFQLQYNFDLIRQNFNPLTVQRGITYYAETRVIDLIYTEANHKQFTLNTLTNPLYINTTWAYLFTFYGLPKYGYLPGWVGRDQSGLLGELPKQPKRGDLHFYVVEPVEGIPDYFIQESKKEEIDQSKLVSTHMIGNFLIEKRQVLP